MVPSVYDQQFFPYLPPPGAPPLPGPSTGAEFWGDTMLVNGTAHPYAEVEPRRYRLRILNACNTRFVTLRLTPGATIDVPTSPRTGGHEYVWHCHILEHEEHDMMRPLVVG